jgi:hypothetical protein
MPLIHSKKPSAFKKNIKTEMAAGKPQKQAVAIAYSEKDHAEHKADGGIIDSIESTVGDWGHSTGWQSGQSEPDKPDLDTTGEMIQQKAQKDPEPDDSYAEGGEVDADDNAMSDAAGEEFMNAIHSKDKKAVWDSFCAMARSFKNRG